MLCLIHCWEGKVEEKLKTFCWSCCLVGKEIKVGKILRKFEKKINHIFLSYFPGHMWEESLKEKRTLLSNYHFTHFPTNSNHLNVFLLGYNRNYKKLTNFPSTFLTLSIYRQNIKLRSIMFSFPFSLINQAKENHYLGIILSFGKG